MKLIQKLLPFFVALIFIQGCYRDEIVTSNPTSTQPNRFGVYVLSEGNSFPEQSKLSFLSYSNGEFSQNITFPTLLGYYPDGITEYNGSLYVLERGNTGGPGKIYKIDTTGVILNSKQFGVNPYSLTILNGKAFCTDGPDSSVHILDINSFNVIKRIKTGLYPQEIVSIGNKVFVANTSIHGIEDSTIMVIDGANDIAIANIKIAGSPTSIAVSSDGYLLASSSAFGGIIYKFAPHNYAKSDSFLVSSLTIKDINVDYYTGKIFFISNNNSIKSLNPLTKETVTIVSQSTLPAIQYINGYGYDTKNKRHYLADAKNFSVYGILYKLNESGALVDQFGLGYSPRRILIRN